MQKEYFKIYVKNISGIETDDIKDGMEVFAYLDNGVLKELYTDTIIYRGTDISDEAFLGSEAGLYATLDSPFEEVTVGEATEALKFYPNVVMTETVPTIAKLVQLTLDKKNEELSKLDNNSKKL